MRFTHPVLSCADAALLEKSLLGDDEEKIWSAMTRAGEGVAEAAMLDWLEIAPLPERFRVLVLCGTGHNGGDALVAAKSILKKMPGADVRVILVYGREKMRPLAARALEEVEFFGGKRAVVSAWAPDIAPALASASYDLCIEGVVGMQMRPPMRYPAPELFSLVSRMDIALRAAVDLPAGLGDGCAEEGFSADFTYATGIVKSPVLERANLGRTGRVRYVDIGFFDSQSGATLRDDGREFILPSVLRPLRRLRPAASDKRSNGHLALIGGSSGMPGAIGMATLGAISSGAGLATALVPPDTVQALAQLAPEAMWKPLPPDSCDASVLESFICGSIQRAGAVVVGPGLDTSGETMRTALSAVIRQTPLPFLLDAGALIPELVSAVKQRPADYPPVIMTPHLGEFARIAGADVLKDGCDIERRMRNFAAEHRVLLLLKGAVTRICDGSRVLCDCFGGPVLARGGSGDLLAGTIGAQIARPGADLLESLCAGALLHGMAAECTARECGQHAVRTTAILARMPKVVRSS